MSLPDTIRVKISSEAAGFISMTPVVAQELPLRDLVGMMLELTGKDAVRLREILKRGSFVLGGSRFRWEGWEAEPAEMKAILAGFPDPEPERQFEPDHCFSAVFRGAGVSIAVTREAASSRRLLSRRTFWDVLLDIAAANPPVYAGYSYREHADRYLIHPSRLELQQLKEESELLRYSTLAGQIRRSSFDTVELLAARPNRPTPA